MQIDVFRSRSSRRFATLLALAALALQLLAAGISAGHLARQLSAARGGEVVLCTPTGLVRIALHQPQAPTPERSGGSPCPFCLVAAGGHATSVAAATAAPLPPFLQHVMASANVGNATGAAQLRLALAQAPPRSV